MRQKELYQKVADDLGMPVEKVRFVIEQYEQALRWFISNPIYAGTKIYIPKLAVFNLREIRLLRLLTRYMNKNPDTARVKYFTYYVRKFINPEFGKGIVDIKWPLK